MKATSSLFFDHRRSKLDGTYPVKLTIYFEGEKKRYDIGISLTEDDWEKVNGKNLRDRRLKDKKQALNFITQKADKVLEGLETFTFLAFEQAFYDNRTNKVKLDVGNAFDICINELMHQDRIGNAAMYRTTKNSILNFSPKVKLPDITPSFLENYERAMRARGVSPTSIGIYLRHLRAILNKAISDGWIKADQYPFKKYKIPGSRNIKKALNFKEIKLLLDYSPELGNQQRALDFWLLSYLCNGTTVRL